MLYIFSWSPRFLLVPHLCLSGVEYRSSKELQITNWMSTIQLWGIQTIISLKYCLNNCLNVFLHIISDKQDRYLLQENFQSDNVVCVFLSENLLLKKLLDSCSYRKFVKKLKGFNNFKSFCIAHRDLNISANLYYHFNLEGTRLLQDLKLFEHFKFLKFFSKVVAVILGL